MKLILEDISKTEIDLDEAEIAIIDKKNPKRTYKFPALGGWILIRRSGNLKNYDVEMKTNIEVINVEFNFSDEITNYRG